jgi:hypothetical protein
MSLLEKLEKSSAGWKGKLISRDGKMVLADSELAAMSVYYMSCFKLPSWVINRIDKIRRDFLWRKNDINKPGIHLMNWAIVCVPKRCGGMKLRDIHL